MRYQPLHTPHRNTYVHPNWTNALLNRFMRYWSRLRWLEHIPFNQYTRQRQPSITQEALL